jgi:tRNA 5-methylaminomethyl-2-thiouridine biosynthesis bifunctional protein
MTDTLHWNDQGQPISNHFDDIYFSTENGLAETNYVFLQQNHLQQRFSNLSENSVFTVAETGFGTGLNFLACCALWEQTAPKTAQLHFVSTEKYPLTKHTIAQAATLWPELQIHTSSLLKVYPNTIPLNQTIRSTEQADYYRFQVTPTIYLSLLIGDATLGLKQLLARTLLETETPDTLPAETQNSKPTSYETDSRQWRGVDAWFLDGFSPSKNPDMWTPELFTTIKKLSYIKTTIATFTAAGVVKRGLLSEGFTLKKVPGYGKKREMLTAEYPQQSAQKNTPTHQNLTNEIDTTSPPKKIKTTQRLSTWALINNYQTVPTGKHIAIVGGGLAGCHTAHALAKKGYQVTLFEKADTLAAEASGNAQGIVYGKLSASGDPLGEMNRYSLRYAQSFYSDYWRRDSKHPATNNKEDKNNSDAGNACGVLQLSLTQKIQQAHQKIAGEVVNDTDNLRHVSAEEASVIANTRIDYPALYFPKLGWINPPKLCEWLIQHPNISIVSHTKITELQQHGTHWRLHTRSTVNDNSSTQIFDAVVIANAYDATQFTQTNTLPVKQIRGQVSHYPSTDISEQLNTVVCGKAYIAPASQGNHCLGASFNLHNDNPALDPIDHQHNIHNIAQQTPDIINSHDYISTNHDIKQKTAKLDGRASFRCVTPDYLPIVGAVPIDVELHTHFGALRKNGRQTINIAGSYYPRLYINIGHGSRGLAYTPLCSEILANLIQGSPPPIPQYLIQKLSPARFTIRDMIRTP